MADRGLFETTNQSKRASSSAVGSVMHVQPSRASSSGGFAHAGRDTLHNLVSASDPSVPPHRGPIMKDTLVAELTPIFDDEEGGQMSLFRDFVVCIEGRRADGSLVGRAVMHKGRYRLTRAGAGRTETVRSQHEVRRSLFAVGAVDVVVVYRRRDGLV